MEYNVGECEVIHFGRNNSKMDYYLNGKKLQHAAVQRDLGVLVHESQKVGLQVQQVIKKANGILSFIARGMEFKNSEVRHIFYTESGGCLELVAGGGSGSGYGSDF